MASSSSPTEPSPPFAVPLLPPPPPPSSRRLPPPCWSPEETSSLIDSYRRKWYSLGRSNLKATHWQEVADAVTASCPNVSPPKTAVQCRHKMEKLRKRYRAEIQRARNLPVKKFNSAWVHFDLMDSMEKGPSPAKSDFVKVVVDDGDDNEVDYEDDDEDRGLIHANPLHKLRGNGIGSSGGGGGGGGDGRRGEGGFRIRIPSGVSVAKPDSRFYPNFSDEKRNPNFGFGGKGAKEGSVLGKRDREKDPVEEMVNAIKVLADGFMRTEQMKMEMAREIERMRMEREMKRTEMILESQHRIVEAFANAVAEQKKKTNQVPSSPES